MVNTIQAAPPAAKQISEKTIRAFHQNVTALFRTAKEPCPREHYRGQVFYSAEEYILLHEEEQPNIRWD